MAVENCRAETSFLAVALAQENGHGMPLHRHTMTINVAGTAEAVPPSQSVVLLLIVHGLGSL